MLCQYQLLLHFELWVRSIMHPFFFFFRPFWGGYFHYCHCHFQQVILRAQISHNPWEMHSASTPPGYWLQIAAKFTSWIKVTSPALFQMSEGSVGHLWVCADGLGGIIVSLTHKFSETAESRIRLQLNGVFKDRKKSKASSRKVSHVMDIAGQVAILREPGCILG